jgi:hypothetical protein
MLLLFIDYIYIYIYIVSKRRNSFKLMPIGDYSGCLFCKCKCGAYFFNCRLGYLPLGVLFKSVLIDKPSYGRR